jgi:phosphopentomutase
MPRALLLVLDSFGIGAAQDADAYGDVGADTLGHIAAFCAAQGRSLHLPNLNALGLGLAAELASGQFPAGFKRVKPRGQYGYGVELSKGKDTPSGHWEMTGTPVPFDWGYFPLKIPCFPAELTSAMIQQGKLPGILGNCRASGTQVIEDFGAEHMRTGAPICYTSTDSVLQIAAHEETFGLQRLYDLCKIVRKLVDPYTIGRVIARPFIGAEGCFVRTANRKDFAVPPPAHTLLQLACEARRDVVSIGKIGDIFAHQFTGDEMKGASNMAHFDMMLGALDTLKDGGLIFANFVDFDTDYGHRRDPLGYADCLQAFDARLPELFARLKPDDLLILTADHGNDPTFKGTDHTREYVPVLTLCTALPTGCIGRRSSFADSGASIAAWLKLPPTPHGKSWV